MKAPHWTFFKISFLALSFLSLSGCMSAKHIKAQEIQTDLALRQMHSEIEEQKYKQSRLEVELQIVEGKADAQSKVTQKILKEISKLSQEESRLLDTTVNELQQKLRDLEEKEEELEEKLNHFALITESNTHSLKLHKEQFNEMDSLLFQQKQSLKDLQGDLRLLLLSCEQEDLGQIFYVVQKGDSLKVIAQENNLTVDSLIKLNELGSHQLVVGQKLRLK